MIKTFIPSDGLLFGESKRHFAVTASSFHQNTKRSIKTSEVLISWVLINSCISDELIQCNNWGIRKFHSNSSAYITLLGFHRDSWAYWPSVSVYPVTVHSKKTVLPQWKCQFHLHISVPSVSYPIRYGLVASFVNWRQKECLF